MRWVLRNVFLAGWAAIGLMSDASAAVTSLKVMSFNVWVGEGTSAGRSKLAEIMTASGADIIGVQELDNTSGMAIAAMMGFHYRQQSGGDIQTISRYPIVDQSSGSLGVKIALSPGQEVWLFNSHLAAYPYQPYDLRDGILPMNEAAVIAAANSARGSQVTNYLNEMADALAGSDPVFFTGDFNEPSHLDWTAAAAAATARPFDLKVEYPTSKRIVDAGLVDSFRAVRPDPVTDTGYTWTPGYPPPTLDADEVHDRIDIVYHKGLGVTPVSAKTVGYPDGSPDTDLEVPGYNADHRAVVVDYTLTPVILGDFNLDLAIDLDDWTTLRTNQLADLSGLSQSDAYQRGDINGDLRNDHADFLRFKEIFDGQNGIGAFATMLAYVPEPSSGVLLAVGLAGACVRRRRPQGS
jgi:endonuclease/exonuclease/phosphatase family metal-dependent hydrolase